MASIYDVAKLAGVSISTVSRAFNNREAVKKETLDRIMAAVDELDYRPNALGRSLRMKETKVILIIATALTSDVISGFYSIAEKRGYRALVYYVGRNQEKGKPYFDDAFMGSVDGVILYNALYEDVYFNKIAEQIPVLLCCCYIDTPHISRVAFDDERAAYDLTKHMIEQGKKKFGIITLDSGGITDSFSLRRERGVSRALQEASLKMEEDCVCREKLEYEGGERAARHLLNKKVDAIIVMHDRMAYYALTVVKEQGLRIPEDVAIAVAGFDNMKITKMTTPPLTTVDLPFFELGEMSMEMLIDYLTGKRATIPDIVFQHELVVRASTVVQENRAKS